MPDVDRCIDRLNDALRVLGLAPLAPVVSAEALDEIAHLLAPWSLPADLRRFWERVEPEALPVFGRRMPPLASPERALAVYRQNNEPGAALVFGLPLLFPLARQSETQWSVELATEWSPGGRVFSHHERIALEYGSVAALLEAYAELLEEGEFAVAAAGVRALT